MCPYENSGIGFPQASCIKMFISAEIKLQKDDNKQYFLIIS